MIVFVLLGSSLVKCPYYGFMALKDYDPSEFRNG